MRVWTFCLSLFFTASCLLAADILIRDITVVDVVTGNELPHQFIRIHGDRITAIGSQAPDAGPQIAGPQIAVPPLIVDGRGKFAIPGLWDMHVHLWYREHQFPLFLAHGVIGVRDMGSDLNWVNQWRDQIRTGKLLGPHIETCGPNVDGRPSSDSKLPVLVVHTPQDARTTFDRLDELDVDFIKILPGIPRDAYFALIERARKYYKPVAGPLPDSVTVAEAIDARQKSVEHLSGIPLACSRHEERLRNRFVLANEKQDWRTYSGLQAEAMASFDAKKAQELFARMARFEMRQVPALTRLRREMLAGLEEGAGNPLLKLISPAIRKTWSSPGSSEEAPIRGLDEYRKLAELVPLMNRAGVAILAGTDTGEPYTVPGDELHRELELLVEAGLTPLDALRGATIEPARYLMADETLGSIGKGKIADLVLLDADPLKDIRNTRSISGVIAAGRYLPKLQIRAMLSAH